MSLDELLIDNRGSSEPPTFTKINKTVKRLDPRVEPFDSDKLQRRLAELGISISQAARDIGVSYDTYRNWVDGRCKPTKEPYYKILKSLDINAVYFK